MITTHYPFAVGTIVAFGATWLVALIARGVSAKLQPLQNGRRNAVLLATGFAWGRFIGIDVATPADIGAMIGAIAALLTLWSLHHVRSTQMTQSEH